MTETRRLIEQNATEVERALLAAARADCPPPNAASQIVAAVHALLPEGANPDLPVHGHDPVAASGQAASDIVASGKGAGLATWAKIAIVGLGLCGAAAVVRSLTSTPSVPVALPLVHTPALTADQPPVVTADQEAPAMAPTEGTPPAKLRSGLRERATIASDHSLAAELRVLNRAREALDAHQPTAAERALETYRRSYPHGHLEPEATVLRLAVLVQQGDDVAARALAEQLLADPSYKTYELRIRSLVRGTEK